MLRNASDSGMSRKRGFTIWFTGLPGAGKTTLANLVCQELGAAGVMVLDGDEVRRRLSNRLGFSKEDRDINIRLIGWICQAFTRQGIPTIAAVVSPYRETRREVRHMVEAVGGRGSFIEVFVNCPLEVCERRDPKGLYARARRGEITHCTGLSDPYEPPDMPEAVVETASESPSDSVKKVMAVLARLGWSPLSSQGSESE